MSEIFPYLNRSTEWATKQVGQIIFNFLLSSPLTLVVRCLQENVSGKANREDHKLLREVSSTQYTLLQSFCVCAALASHGPLCNLTNPHYTLPQLMPHAAASSLTHLLYDLHCTLTYTLCLSTNCSGHVIAILMLGNWCTLKAVTASAFTWLPSQLASNKQSHWRGQEEVTNHGHVTSHIILQVIYFTNGT